MPARQRIADAELLAAKRGSVRTARLRRKIDRRTLAVQHEAIGLTSWKTYVRRYPLGAVVAALGLGLTLSAGLSPRRVSRWLGTSLASAAFSALRQGLWRDVMKVWNSVESGRDSSVS